MEDPKNYTGPRASTVSILAKWNPAKGGGAKIFSTMTPPQKVPSIQNADPKTIAQRS